jgi:hypothetical protein
MKTNKLQKVNGRQMKTWKYNLPQSGSFVAFSCFRPVPLMQNTDQPS